MLALLEAVVNVRKLQCIGAQAPFKHEQLLNLAYGDMSPLDLGCHVVIGQAAFFALLHPHDPVLTLVKLQ